MGFSEAAHSLSLFKQKQHYPLSQCLSISFRTGSFLGTVCIFAHTFSEAFLGIFGREHAQTYTHTGDRTGKNICAFPPLYKHCLPVSSILMSLHFCLPYVEKLLGDFFFPLPQDGGGQDLEELCRGHLYPNCRTLVRHCPALTVPSLPDKLGLCMPFHAFPPTCLHLPISPSFPGRH